MTETLAKTEDFLPSQVSESDENIILAAKGGGIAFAGNLFGYALRFLFGLVLARLLGAELLGLYSLSSTITGVVGVLSPLGLGAAIVRYVPIAIGHRDEARLWGVIQTGLALPTLVSSALAIGVFLLAEPLACAVFGRPDLVPVLRLASFGIPIYALMSELSSTTQAFKRMEYKVYAEDTALNLLKLVLSLAFLVMGFSVMGVVLAHNVALAVSMGMLLYFVHRLFPLNRPLKTAKRNLREMLGFSLPLYLTRVLSQLSGSLESLVLGSFGLVSGIGIYTTALRMSEIGNLFHHSLQRIALPMISDLFSRGELGQLTRVYRTTTKWGMTFNLPVFLTIALFAEPLLSIFGPEFVVGAAGLTILAFATLFNASTGVCGSVITMTGYSKLTFSNSIVFFVLNIALDLLLIPHWGVIGAALAVTLADVIINVLRTAQVLVLLRIWPYDWSFLKPMTASLLAAGVTYFVGQLLILMPLILQVAVGASVLWSVYASAIVLMKLSEEDRLVLSRLWARFGFWRV